MEKKKQKLTSSQLQKRLDNAVLHIDRTKETKTMFFDDKGVRLTVDDQNAIIETGYHRHVFSSITGSGMSRPYLYTKQVLDLGIRNIKDITVRHEDGNLGASYGKLLEVLKSRGEQAEFQLATYYEWWLMVIFDGLYSIGETEVSAWLVFFKYVCVIATNSIVLEEHKSGLTNKKFVSKFFDLVKEITDSNAEHTLFEPMTDDEMVKKEIEAIQQQDMDDTITEQLLNYDDSENQKAR